jgi:putative SOS response-associated peptidase YedK
MITLHHDEPLFIGMKWGYRTPEEAKEKKKPWIKARIEKVLKGRYFRHMFREGRVIIPAGGWYEWTVEEGKKQPWYITRKVDAPIFMAGLTNHKAFAQQEIELGFVIGDAQAVAQVILDNPESFGFQLLIRKDCGGF